MTTLYVVLQRKPVNRKPSIPGVDTFRHLDPTQQGALSRYLVTAPGSLDAAVAYDWLVAALPWLTGRSKKDQAASVARLETVAIVLARAHHEARPAAVPRSRICAG